MQFGGVTLAWPKVSNFQPMKFDAWCQCRNCSWGQLASITSINFRVCVRESAKLSLCMDPILSSIRGDKQITNYVNLLIWLQQVVKKFLAINHLTIQMQKSEPLMFLTSVHVKPKVPELSQRIARDKSYSRPEQESKIRSQLVPSAWLGFSIVYSEFIIHVDFPYIYFFRWKSSNEKWLHLFYQY